jgi:hypothetical protein
MTTTIDYKFEGDDRIVGAPAAAQVDTCDGGTKLASAVVAGDMICINKRRGTVEEVGQTVVDDVTGVAEARVILSP